LLVHPGYTPYRARRLANQFCPHNLETIDKTHEVFGDQEQVISVALKAREEVEKLFRADDEAFAEEKDKGWD
jgi:glutathione-regulated potassium-efflux system ancillary protein KefC